MPEDSGRLQIVEGPQFLKDLAELAEDFPEMEAVRASIHMAL